MDEKKLNKQQSPDAAAARLSDEMLDNVSGGMGGRPQRDASPLEAIPQPAPPSVPVTVETVRQAFSKFPSLRLGSREPAGSDETP